MRKRVNLYILVFLVLSSGPAGLVRADSVESILQRHKQTKTRLTMLAVEAQSGKIICRRDSEKPMIPASNMKLVTTAAAFHYLGSEYAFKTQVGLLGDDMVIVGGGDPLLGDPKNDASPSESANRLMAKIVSVLRDSGITKINNMIVDTTFFDNNRVHPSWPADQLNQWYACEISGLNFYDNCIHILAENNGGRAVLTMEPQNDYVQLRNELKIISQGSSAVGGYRNSVPNHLFVRGKLNQKAGFDLAIENPAGLFASVLKSKLQSGGITVEGNLLQKYVKNESGIRFLVVFQTPISDVIKRANTDSLGLAAECLVKTISAENTKGQINGEWPHGLNLVSRYLMSLSVPADQFTLDDGSGLSRNNRLSAQCLVAVLQDMYARPDSRVFIDSLAVGGQEGTIAKFFHKTPYNGNISGKTGYIAGVRSFSGICRTPRGDILFSILTEGGNSSTRACINEITEALFDGKL